MGALFLLGMYEGTRGKHVGSSESHVGSLEMHVGTGKMHVRMKKLHEENIGSRFAYRSLKRAFILKVFPSE